MPRGKTFTAEQIIGKLREAEVGLAQGKTAPGVVRKLGVTEQTYYRWKREHGGLRTDEAKRLKDLEKENARLKRLLADAEPSCRAFNVLVQNGSRQPKPNASQSTVPLSGRSTSITSSRHSGSGLEARGADGRMSGLSREQSGRWGGRTLSPQPQATCRCVMQRYSPDNATSGRSLR